MAVKNIGRMLFYVVGPLGGDDVAAVVAEYQLIDENGAPTVTQNGTLVRQIKIEYAPERTLGEQWAEILETIKTDEEIE